ncbi:MAG: glutamate-1-semialdehyde 2,1-aminomutase [Bacteroidetes bacterium]|nr:glutamate-1-semialdehyde 2,1-aminomutase [Bacteroidota bacterium]
MISYRLLQFNSISIRIFAAKLNYAIMNFQNSISLFESAKKYFPGGVNSPVRAFKSVGGTPIFIEHGKGSHIWDEDKNEYIDYCCSWGPLILGHANDTVLTAVEKTMRKGTSFGAPSRAENELAELILKNNSYIEKLRFVSSGTEAVMSAIRLARGYTKRNKILKFEGCYHGHADSLLVKAGSGLVTFGNSSSAGVPQSFVNETISVELNDKTAVEKAFEQFKNEIACIIIEPIPANNGLLLQDKSFLTFLREICSVNKSLLIFDEVISGFRIGFEGAAGYFNIKPDIITYGKIIGGGFPVGAYGASHQIMSCISPEGSVYQAGTLSGNPVAMSAGKAQLTECLKENFYTGLSTKTNYLVNGILKNNTFKLFKLFSIGSVFWISFTDKEKINSSSQINANNLNHFNKLYHLLLEEGVYLGPSGYEVGFVSEAHSYDDLDKTIKAFSNALSKL